MMTTEPRRGAPLRREGPRPTFPLVRVDHDPPTGDVVVSFADDVPNYDFDELVDGVSITFDAHRLGRLVSVVMLGPKAGRSPAAQTVFDAVVGKTVAGMVAEAVAAGRELRRSPVDLEAGAVAALGRAWKTLHAVARARLYAPGTPADEPIGNAEPAWDELAGVVVLATPATAAERLRAEPSRRMPLPPEWAAAAGLGAELVATEQPGGRLRVRIGAGLGGGPARGPLVRLADPPHGRARLVLGGDGYEATIPLARPLNTKGLNNLTVVANR